MIKRIYLLPIMIIWWLCQLWIFSICLGGISILIGIISFFENIIKDDDKDWEFTLVLLSAPFISPIIWWVRYFKNGEYGILKEWQ